MSKLKLRQITSNQGNATAYYSPNHSLTSSSRNGDSKHKIANSMSYNNEDLPNTSTARVYINGFN